MWIKNIGLVFALIFIFVGCSENELVPEIGEISVVDQVNLDPDMILTADKEVYKPNVRKIKVELTNLSDKDCSYGWDCILEYEIAGKWHYMISAVTGEIAYNEEKEVAPIVRAGSTDEFEIDMSFFGNSFPKGHYRIILDCFQYIDKEGKFWSYLSDERLSCDFYIE